MIQVFFFFCQQSSSSLLERWRWWSILMIKMRMIKNRVISIWFNDHDDDPSKFCLYWCVCCACVCVNLIKSSTPKKVPTILGSYKKLIVWIGQIFSFICLFCLIIWDMATSIIHLSILCCWLLYWLNSLTHSFIHTDSTNFNWWSFFILARK